MIADIWTEIARNIDAGSDYKALCLVNRAAYTGCRAVFPTARVRFGAPRFDVMLKYSPVTSIDAMNMSRADVPLGYIAATSQHDWWTGWPPARYFNARFFRAYRDKPWNWNMLSISEYVTRDIVLEHADAPWNWCALLRRLQFDPDEIVAGMTIREILMRDITRQQHISVVLAAVDRTFKRGALPVLAGAVDYHDWRDIIYHPIMCRELITMYPTAKWDWNMLAVHPCVDADFMAANRQLPWLWFLYHDNVNFRPADLARYPDDDWAWNIVGGNAIVSMDMIRALTAAGKLTSWETISMNPNLDAEFLRENVENIYWYDAMTSVHADIICETADLPWPWMYIYANKTITVEHVDKLIAMEKINPARNTRGDVIKALL